MSLRINKWALLVFRCHCATSYHGKLYVFGGELEKVNKKVTRGKKELSKHAYW